MLGGCDLELERRGSNAVTALGTTELDTVMCALNRSRAGILNLSKKVRPLKNAGQTRVL